MTIMSLKHSLANIHFICKNLKIRRIVHVNNFALQLVKI